MSPKANDRRSKAELLAEVDDLRVRLQECEETLRAIRSGEVDAIVVSGPAGEQVYSLSGSESIYRLTMETMSEAALTVALDGRITFCNRQFSQLVDTPQERIVGRRFQEFVAADNAAAAESLLVIVQEKPVRQRLVFQTAAGRPVPVHATGSLLVQEGQSRVCIVAADLTELENSAELVRELRRQQDALEASQRRLALATSATGVGMFEWDVTTGKLLWTSTHEALFGYAPAVSATATTTTTTTTEHEYRHWADRVHPDDLSPTEAMARRCLEHREPLHMQYRIFWPDGSLHWIETRGVLVEGGKGRRPHVLGTAMDITERKQAEEAIDAAHRQLQSVIDNTTSLVYAFDLEERFTMVNAAVAKLLGSSPQQMIGKRRGEFMAEQDANWHEANDRKVIEAGHPLEFEEYGQLQDRSITWLTTKFPLRDARGRITAVAGISADITERKQAEEALREREESLRRLCAAMNDGLVLHEIVCDAAGRAVDYRLLDVNPAFERITGIRRERAVGTLASELYGPGGAPYLDVYARVAAGGQPESFETEFEPMAKAFSISVFSPAPGRFATVFADITGRKRAEEALRNLNAELERRVAERTSELVRTGEALKTERQRLYDVLETLPAYVILLDDDYHVSFANRYFEERFGKSDGRRCYEYLFQRTEPCDNCETYRVLKTGLPHHWEWTGPDGCDYAITDVPFKDADGSPMIMEMGIDITSRRQAEAAVRAERQRLFDVLETLPAMICLLTPDRRVAFANRSFREKFGESRGRHCHKQRFGLQEPCGFCESYRTLETGQPHHWEINCVDGTVIDAHNFPFTDADGSPMILEMDLDITARRQAEQALRKRSEQLARLTSELTMAEQRERQRLAQVLHDGLQQLLVAARFRLNVLEMSADDVVKKEAGELSELIADSIETSRSLTAELSPPVLKSGLVPALEWLARWMRDRHGLVIELDASVQTEPLAENVKVLLFQAARELLFNVVKHAGVKAARMIVSRDDHRVVVTVEDKGRGFDPARQPGDTGQTGGLGLFAIAERLELLGGLLRIDSAPGQGSRLTLTVPFAWGMPAVAAETMPEARVSVGFAAPTATATTANRLVRIVLVDDHAVVRQGLATVLRREERFEIVGEASDGESAVELVRQLQPDVVLMDISMPGMKGIEATRAIRAQLPKVCVIGLTMHEDAHADQEMRAAGAAACLSKSGPVDSIVRTILDCRGEPGGGSACRADSAGQC
jgi:PAS domain S-box-containing protein